VSVGCTNEDVAALERAVASEAFGEGRAQTHRGW